ncbi:MAG: ribonuclease HII [Clostridia bacterium]|nr:ribonuclease HII [Clostridia bacterium]
MKQTKEREPVDWLQYEREAAQEGFCVVCGVDEAGRGPLAGPVFAAAVVLHQGQIIEGANDSKKLSEKKREALFDVIVSEAADYCIASVDEKTIDEINILQATYLAMTRAVEGLKNPPSLCLIDGNRTPPQIEIPCRAIVKGDANSMSIACASILAKVSRDRFMLELDKDYPQYGFSKHKGYGTALHIEMLRQYGASPVHRRSFLKKIEGIPEYHGLV